MVPSHNCYRKANVQLIFISGKRIFKPDGTVFKKESKNGEDEENEEGEEHEGDDDD